MAKPSAPRIPSNITRDVHEHEVFFSFVDDLDAERFHEWWQSKGLKAWQQWCDEEKEHPMTDADRGGRE